MKSSFLDFEPLLNAGLIGRCLNPVQWIYLTRRDLVLRAISFVRARQSQIWHRLKDQEPLAENSIQELLLIKELFLGSSMTSLLTNINGNVFSIYSISPLRITYEDMLEGIPAVTNKIAAHMEIELTCDSMINEAETKIIGDEVNALWAENFRMKFQI